jgi:hypothetical protein
VETGTTFLLFLSGIILDQTRFRFRMIIVFFKSMEVTGLWTFFSASDSEVKMLCFYVFIFYYFCFVMQLSLVLSKSVLRVQ